MPERETASQLNSGAIHLLRAMRRVDRTAGLPSARLSALSVLVFGGPATMGQLAAAEAVAAPTMTRIVAGLVEAGLARRRVQPGPGRPVRVTATAKGDRLMRRAAGRRLDAITDAIRELPASDRRRLGAAAPVLDRLAEILRER